MKFLKWLLISIFFSSSFSIAAETVSPKKFPMWFNLGSNQLLWDHFVMLPSIKVEGQKVRYIEKINFPEALVDGQTGVRSSSVAVYKTIDCEERSAVTVERIFFAERDFNGAKVFETNESQVRRLGVSGLDKEEFEFVCSFREGIVDAESDSTKDESRQIYQTVSKPLITHSCDSIEHAKTCNGSCSPLEKGAWSRDFRVDIEKGRIVVATMHHKKVDSVFELNSCTIFDRYNWTCPAVPSVTGGEILLTYRMRNNRLFHTAEHKSVITTFSCAK